MKKCERWVDICHAQDWNILKWTCMNGCVNNYCSFIWALRYNLHFLTFLVSVINSRSFPQKCSSFLLICLTQHKVGVGVVTKDMMLMKEPHQPHGKTYWLLMRFLECHRRGAEDDLCLCVSSGQQGDLLQTQPTEEVRRQHHIYQLYPQTGRTPQCSWAVMDLHLEPSVCQRTPIHLLRCPARSQSQLALVGCQSRGLRSEALERSHSPTPEDKVGQKLSSLTNPWADSTKVHVVH